MRVRSTLACLLAAVTVLAACTSEENPDPEPTGTPAPIQVVDLTFGVWGTDEEIAAYQDVVDLYDQLTDEVTVDLESFSTHEELLAAVKAGDVPDVFLVQRGDLSYLLDNDVTQPIGERLDERDVQFGDDYSAGRPRGVLLRPRPAVHAVRHLAVRRLLQHQPHRLRPDGRARARRAQPRPGRQAALVARRVPGRCGLRHPARAVARTGSTCPRRWTAWRRSSSPVAVRCSTTMTTRRRSRSPPTTPVPRSRRSCRSCATRS